MKMCSNFNRNVVQKKSAFNSIEEDIERSIKRLFVEDKNIANELKSLLIIPHKNCLTEIKNYENIINKYSLSKLMQDDFIRISPKMIYDFNAENQAGINVSVDLAAPTSNEEYLQYSLSFFCMCNIDVWELDNFKQRPLRMAGIIEGALNGSEVLKGIGELKWIGTSRLTVNDNLAGYITTFKPIITRIEDKNGEN